MIPDAALEHHIAVLAKTGAGKSYAAQGIAERLLGRGDRVAVIDPTGRWWGLRSNAAGDGPGYPVVVFGGHHADVPLEPHHGTELAEIVGTTNTPAIFDTRAMTVSGRTRFFTDFAETLIRKNAGPLTLIVDEAHLFMPQGGAKVGGGAPAMLHAGNNLVSLGRGVGLRIVLISQRPAKIHKDALTQAETLIALRLIAPQDRNAIKDWIAEWADPSEGADLLAGLPSLPTGTGWIWAPELGVLEKVTFPLIETYDGGKPQSEEAPVLASIDVPEIMDRLGRIAEEAKANDPKALRKRVAELERELAKGGAGAEEVAAAEERGYSAGFGDGQRKAAAEVKRLAERLADPKSAPVPEAPAHTAGSSNGRTPGFGPGNAGSSPAPAATRPVVRNHRTSQAEGDLHRAARAILTVLAQHHPAKLTWQQAATLAGLKARGGHFNAGRKELRERGLIEEPGGLVTASETGMAEAGEVPQRPDSPAELLAMWKAKLPSPAPEMLEYLAWMGGPVAKGEMAEALNKQPRGGHWNGGIAVLRNNGLIHVDGETVRVDDLFLGR